VIDLAVATDAADTTIHMHRVIKIGEVRDLMDFHPIYWLTCLPAFTHRGQFRIRGLDLGVAIHAGLSCRHVRVGGNFDVGMAISAIHSELSNMNIVGKRDRLDRLVSYAHIVRR